VRYRKKHHAKAIPPMKNRSKKGRVSKINQVKEYISKNQSSERVRFKKQTSERVHFKKPIK